MTDHKIDKSTRARLIAEIYEVALKPELYGSMVDLWDREITAAVSKLKNLEDAQEGENVLGDPELEDHFRRAYEILDRFGRYTSNTDTIENFLDHKSETTLLFSSDGNCVGKNSPATEIFGEITNLKQLRTFAKDEFKSLASFVTRANRALDKPEVLVVQMEINSGEKNNRYDAIFIAQTIRLSNMAHNLVCLTNLSINWTNTLSNLLEKNFSITPSELEILHELCTGKNLNEIAHDRNRSLHTIRTQLKSVYPKLGTNSQADLVRTISTLASHITEPNNLEKLSQYKLTMGEMELVPLKLDRHIPVNIFGPEDGNPVLFIHGMLDGFIFSDHISKLIHDHKIRLYAPTRPGFGENPFAYSSVNAPTDFAADIAQVLNHYQIEQCPIIGHMAGSLYAFEAARQLKERISHIITIAGGVPILSLKQFSAMSPRQRVVAWTAKFTPSLLPMLLRAGISQMDAGKQDEFMRALYPEGSVDLATVADPAIATAIQEGYKFAVAQGHRAFEVDATYVTRDWNEYLVGNTIPVTLFHGTHDPVVVIDSVREFANSYQNHSLVELENCGQLILFQQPETVFNHLSDF